MTNNQHVKRLARERAAATGQSYTKALYAVREELRSAPRDVSSQSPFDSPWNGEVDPDPLTFYVGRDVVTGEWVRLVLGSQDSHVAMTGAAGTGKSSVAEVVAAQVLIKTMPWDATLRGQVALLSPHKPKIEPWRKRPGVVTSHDFSDPEDTEDADLSREGMLAAWLRRTVQNRADLLSSAGVNTWLNLTDEVRQQERLAPLLVIADDYPHYASPHGGSGLTVEQRNVTGAIKEIARRGVACGIYVFLVTQAINPSLVSASLRSNLSTRIHAGPVNKSDLMKTFESEKTLEGYRGDRHDGLLRRGPGADIESIRLIHLGDVRAVLDRHLPRRD